MFSTFVQDDWQIASKFKLLYGIRYDLYKYPEGLPNAPLSQTHEFNIDRNNIGPRVGVAWQLDSRRPVLRASTGIMYRPGHPRRLRTGAAAVGLAARAVLHVQPDERRRAGVPGQRVGTGTVAQQSPWAVDPDFQVAHTWQSTRRSNTRWPSDLSASSSAMYAKG